MSLSNFIVLVYLAEDKLSIFGGAEIFEFTLEGVWIFANLKKKLQNTVKNHTFFAIGQYSMSLPYKIGQLVSQSERGCVEEAY